MPQLEISGITFGPFGIGHLDGKTIMVARAVPGDVLEVEIESEHRDYATARITRVVRPSAFRRSPPCEYLPRCGGCDWQQIAYPEQVRLKGDLIADELGRALATEIDRDGLVEPAPAEFQYRSRVRLKVGARDTLGYYEGGTNRLVAIERCLVAGFDLDAARELVAALPGRISEIEIVGGAGGLVLVAHLRKALRASDREAGAKLIALRDGVAGVILRAHGERAVIGNAVATIDIESDLALEADADLFSQVNREQNLKLVATVMRMSGAAPEVRVLDLFCGAGNFSIAAARRGARVLGVDADSLATAAASRNAARLSLGDAQFVAMKAAEIASFLVRARYRPEVVILDPPRVGALELIEPIALLAPRTIVYVSCDVSTLARDLRALSRHRYALQEVRAFDFFPNTHHIEIAGRAVLT
ncbi:MAG: class I SAM-dependent RNA methyltransferase [Candidatus Binataceae bacterium]